MGVRRAKTRRDYQNYISGITGVIIGNDHYMWNKRALKLRINKFAFNWFATESASFGTNRIFPSNASTANNNEVVFKQDDCMIFPTSVQFTNLLPFFLDCGRIEKKALNRKSRPHRFSIASYRARWELSYELSATSLRKSFGQLFFMARHSEVAIFIVWF